MIAMFAELNVGCCVEVLIDIISSNVYFFELDILIP